MHRARQFLALCIAACLPFTAAAEVRETDAALAARAELLRQSLASKMAQIDMKHRELMGKMQEVEIYRRDLELIMNRVADPELAQYRGAGSHISVATPGAVGAEQQEEFEAQKEQLPDLPRISQEIGGVLTPRGRLIIEPSYQYIQNTVNRVNLNGLVVSNAVAIGEIDVRGVDRQTNIWAASARYGLTNRLEAEIKGSYVIRDDDTRTRPLLDESSADEIFSADASDFGDMEFGLRYQFNRGINWPFMVGNLRVKSDTGTDPFDIAGAEGSGAQQFAGELATGSGFWSINPSVTFIYPTDPVAFFGNVGYLWTLEDDKGTKTVTEIDPLTLAENTVTTGFGKVDPGDAWRFNFGMGVGLNDRSSFSISYQLDFFDETTIENSSPQKITGSDATIGKLIVGYSIRLPGGSPFNLAIGVGATDEAPDTDVSFRMPFTVKN